MNTFPENYNPTEMTIEYQYYEIMNCHIILTQLSGLP